MKLSAERLALGLRVTWAAGWLYVFLTTEDAPWRLFATVVGVLLPALLDQAVLVRLVRKAMKQAGE
jgi:hypothetical protein